MKQQTIMKYFTLAFMAILWLNSCGPAQPEGMVLSGRIQDADDMQFFFDAIVMNNTQVIAKSPIDADGNFRIELQEQPEAGIYRLRVGSQKALIFLDGTEKQVEINTALSNLGAYNFKMEGAPAATELISNVKKIRDREIDVQGITDLVEQADDAILAMHYSAALQPSPANMVVMKKVVGRLEAEYPESDYTAQYKAQIDNIEKQLARMQSQELIKVGQPAPDIELPNPDGEVMRLSDLKGQVVLLDFWASWCGPCRRANPHVVSTYEKFKNQGFTVFSVSLDRPGQADRWKQAIEQDNLNWPYHVSDLKYWNSAPASTYGVRGIPKTFLIDKDGTIASTNVNPYNLDEALEQLL